MTSAAANNTAAEQKTTGATVTATAPRSNTNPDLSGIEARLKPIAAAVGSWMSDLEKTRKTRVGGKRAGTTYRPQNRRPVAQCGALWLIATSDTETQPEMLGLELSAEVVPKGGEPGSRGLVIRTAEEADALIRGLNLPSDTATIIRDRIAVIERFNPEPSVAVAETGERTDAI